MVTQEQIEQLFEYQEGVLYWKVVSGRRIKIGDAAGSTDKQGYISTSIKGKAYKIHRLVFLLHYGYLPKVIDHIDGNKQNNSFTNLREVTRFENLQNMRKATKANKIGLLGVSAHQGKWRTQIMVNGKRIRASGFDTPELAHQKYLELKREHHLTCTI